MLSDKLNIVHEIPGGVFFELRTGGRPCAASLIEEHDSVMGGVKKTAVYGVAAAAGSAMEEKDGLPIRITALLYINFMERRGF
jgi:hypothetical protein